MEPEEADGAAAEPSAAEDLNAAAAPAADGAESAVDAAAAAGEVDVATSAFERAADFFEVGGPVVVVLLVLSLIALTIAVAKTLQLSGARLGERKPTEAALAHWRRGEAEAALERARSGRGPSARVLASALEAEARGATEAQAREEAYRAGLEISESLRSYLRPLEVIASLAPLLGLFGTVLGMIEAFARLQAAGRQVDPAILSGGIWEALLTTAVGLAVAIPTVAAFNWFERRVERVEARMQGDLSAFFATFDRPARAAADARRAPAAQWSQSDDLVDVVRA